MASVFRTIGLAALLAAAPGAAWAQAEPSGSYQADVWGPVELSPLGRAALASLGVAVKLGYAMAEGAQDAELDYRTCAGRRPQTGP